MYGRVEKCLQSLVQKHRRESGHFQDLRLNGKTTVEWILKKWRGGHGLVWSGSGEGQMARSFECGDDLLG